MFSFAIARRQLSVFLVFKSSKWVVNCSKQSQKVLENQEFPGFDSVLPWQTKSIFIKCVQPPEKPYSVSFCSPFAKRFIIPPLIGFFHYKNRRSAVCGAPFRFWCCFHTALNISAGACLVAAAWWERALRLFFHNRAYGLISLCSCRRRRQTDSFRSGFRHRGSF